MRGGMRARLSGHGKGRKGGLRRPPPRAARASHARGWHTNPLHLPLALPPAYAAAGMGERGGGMAGRASREPRIRRGEGADAPRRAVKGPWSDARGKGGEFLVRMKDRAQRGL